MIENFPKFKDDAESRLCLGYFAMASAHSSEEGMRAILRSPTMKTPRKLCMAFFFNLYVSAQNCTPNV